MVVNPFLHISSSTTTAALHSQVFVNIYVLTQHIHVYSMSHITVQSYTRHLRSSCCVINWLMSCGASRPDSLPETYPFSSGSTNNLHCSKNTQQLVAALQLLMQKSVICRLKCLRFQCQVFQNLPISQLVQKTIINNII